MADFLTFDPGADSLAVAAVSRNSQEELIDGGNVQKKDLKNFTMSGGLF